MNMKMYVRLFVCTYIHTKTHEGHKGGYGYICTHGHTCIPIRVSMKTQMFVFVYWFICAHFYLRDACICFGFVVFRPCTCCRVYRYRYRYIYIHLYMYRYKPFRTKLTFVRKWICILRYTFIHTHLYLDVLLYLYVYIRLQCIVTLTVVLKLMRACIHVYTYRYTCMSIHTHI